MRFLLHLFDSITADSSFCFVLFTIFSSSPNEYKVAKKIAAQRRTAVSARRWALCGGAVRAHPGSERRRPQAASGGRSRLCVHRGSGRARLLLLHRRPDRAAGLIHPGPARSGKRAGRPTIAPWQVNAASLGNFTSATYPLGAAPP